MKGVNKVIVVGALGKDPEMKTTAAGSGVANFSIAVNESWKDKATGEKKESTEWIRVVAFNRLAEIIGQYVKKGSKVYIEGKMRTRKWEKDGHTNYTTEIVASEMQMLDSVSEAAPARDEPGKFDGFDDDIPF